MTDLKTSDSEQKSRNPEFTIGIRGYDRAQVDEYIDYLEGLLDRAEDRARDAQAEYVFDEHAAIGPRIAEIFALAEAEARDLRDNIGNQTTGLVEAARAEARAILDSAKRSATEARERAERDHVVMFAELEEERERIRAEVAVLERCKAEAIGELNRLRQLLGEAAGVFPAPELRDRGEMPTQVIARSDETAELPVVTAKPDKR